MLYAYYYKLICLLDSVAANLPEIFYIRYQNYDTTYSIKEFEHILKVYTLSIKILIYTISYIEESVGASNLLLNKIDINSDLDTDFHTMFFISFEEFYQNSQINNKFLDLDMNFEIFDTLYIIGHLNKINYAIFQKSFEFINLVFKSELAYSEPINSIRKSRYGCSTSYIDLLIEKDLLRFKECLIVEYYNTKNKEKLINSLLNDLINLKSFKK
jgi:hypothetical protein